MHNYVLLLRMYIKASIGFKSSTDKTLNPSNFSTLYPNYAFFGGLELRAKLNELKKRTTFEFTMSVDIYGLTKRKEKRN